MSVETNLHSALTGLVAGRVYPDVAPFNAALPRVTYQQVGGEPRNYISGVPQNRNGRFQINAWASTRIAAATLIRQIEDAVRLSTTLNAVTIGGAVAIYETDTKLYGAMQDYSIEFT